MTLMNKYNFALSFFVTRIFFSGTIYSLMFNTSSKDSIISFLLGTIIGIICIIIINKIKFNKNNIFLRLVIYLLFLIMAFSSFENFATSFMLTKTPKIIVIMPIIILSLYTALKSNITLKKASFIFINLSIISFLITMFLLSKYVTMSNMLPLFTNSINNIIKSSFTFGVLSSFPNILLKEENIPLKKHITYYLISSFINIVIGILTLGALTPAVAKIYSFPEYMVLKRIKFLEFIENIENIAVSVWYFDYFIFITLCFKRIINIIKNKTVSIMLIILTALLVSFYLINNYIYTIFIYHNFQYIIYILFILLILSGFIKSNEKYK